MRGGEGGRRQMRKRGEVGRRGRGKETVKGEGEGGRRQIRKRGEVGRRERGKKIGGGGGRRQMRK